jgi:ribosomal protein L32E
MSIRLLARDLYKAQQEVDRLKKDFESAPAEKKARLETALRKAITERNQLRRVLDGQIDR